MKSILCFSLALFAIQTFAQDKAGNPTGLSSTGWQVDAASSRDYANKKSMFYYKLQYRGNTITERGNQLTPATLGGAWKIPKVASDSDEFKFDLADGVGKLTGPIFDSLMLKPLSFKLPFGDLRGAVQVAGKLTGSQELNVGFGLETKPYTPLRNRALDLTNQVRFGVMGMKHSDSPGTNNRDYISYTYRAYVGTGFGYVRSYKLDDLVNDLVNRFSTLTKDQRDQLIRQGDSADPLVQSLNLMSPEELKDPEKVRDALKHYYDARIDQPTISFEVAADGAYTPDNFVNRRYNSLWSASMYWWPTPRNPDAGKFFITYQNGYTRSDLTNSVNGLVVGFSLKF